MPRIEKNVAPPKGTKGAPRKYPWFGKMEVGDSIFFPNSGFNPGFAAYAYGKKVGKKFSARAENNGVRIWRVA